MKLVRPAKTSKKTYFSIGLLATGVIAFELVLIQNFSITQWYHFAYMVISMAMLGFGAEQPLGILIQYLFPGH